MAAASIVRLSGRTRRILNSAASTGGARVVSVVCAFVSVPLCMRYLGVEAFGVWATITSVMSLLAFADLGIGNGILSRIGAALGRNDSAAIRRTVASAAVLLLAVAGAMLVLYAGVFRWVPWSRVLGTGDAVPPSAVAAAMAVLGVVLVLNLPTTIVQRTQYALQMGHLNGLSQAGAGLLSLVLIYAVSHTGLGLAGMVGATLMAPVLTTWISARWTFRAERGLRLTPRDVDRGEMKVVFASGAKFLVMGLAFCLCQTTDNLIVAHVLGPQAVASFAVHQKYVAPIAFVAGLVLTPLWPAYAEALARRDVRWVRRMFMRSLAALAVTGLVLSLVLLAAAEPFFALWLHGRVAVDDALAIALCVWVSAELVGKAVAMFLNGVDLIAEQLWLALLHVPVCLGLKVAFAHWLGVAGVPLAACLAYVLVHAPAYYLLVRRWYRDNPLDAPHDTAP